MSRRNLASIKRPLEPPLETSARENALDISALGSSPNRGDTSAGVVIGETGSKAIARAKPLSPARAAFAQALAELVLADLLKYPPHSKP